MSFVEDDLRDFLQEKYEAPTKMTVVFLSFAMNLSYEQTMDLLNRAGLTLSHSNKKDLIIEYFLCHNIYDIFLLSEKLEKYGK